MEGLGAWKEHSVSLSTPPGSQALSVPESSEDQPRALAKTGPGVGGDRVSQNQGSPLS